MGCISSTKNKNSYCVEFELSQVAEIANKKTKCDRKQSKLIESDLGNKSKCECSQSHEPTHLCRSNSDNSHEDCSENTADSQRKDNSICINDLRANKLSDGWEINSNNGQQLRTIICDDIKVLNDPKNLNIKCIHLYAKEYIAGIKIDYWGGDYRTNSKSVLHSSSYEYYYETYLIIEPNETITEIKCSQDNIGIYWICFNTSNGRSVELYGDVHRLITLTSPKNKRSQIKHSSKVLSSYNHVLVGLKTEFNDHLVSIACYSCPKDALKPFIVSSSKKSSKNQSAGKVIPVENFSHDHQISAEKSTFHHHKLGRIDFMTKYRPENLKGRLSTINEIENM